MVFSFVATAFGSWKFPTYYAAVMLLRVVFIPFVSTFVTTFTEGPCWVYPKVSSRVTMDTLRVQTRCESNCIKQLLLEHSEAMWLDIWENAMIPFANFISPTPIFFMIHQIFPHQSFPPCSILFSFVQYFNSLYWTDVLRTYMQR